MTPVDESKTLETKRQVCVKNTDISNVKNKFNI